MDDFLSPSYTHEKLEEPSFSDLVDVFEDLWRHYIFDPVRFLMRTQYGDIAAMIILCSYFEAIQSYTTGESSLNRSKDFFVKGFMQVFSSKAPGIENAAQEIYKYIRCGLAHEGMLSHKVSYSRAGAKAFFLTYPKKPDGNPDVCARVVSIIVNPARMYEGTEHHFNGYINKLRVGDDQDLCDAFQKSVERQWDLGSSEKNVGITESEFLGNA